jgi:C4-dicarboxylate-specific signal transduction histidine kinase
MKLRLKFFLSLGILISVISLLAIFFSYLIVRNEVFDLKEEDYEFIAEGYAEELEQVFIQADEIAEKIAQSDQVKEYLMDFDGDFQREDILTFFRGYEIGERFSAIYLLNKDGLTLSSTEPSFTGNNYGFRQYFRGAMKEGSGHQMAVGVTTGEPGYFFGRAVLSDSGEKLGVVALKMSPGTIYETIGEHSVGDIDVMLVEKNSIIIHSKNTDHVFKSLVEISEEDKKNNEIDKNFPGVDIGDIGYEEILSLFQEKKAGTTMAK